MTPEKQQAAMKQFLVGLEKLTRETGIAIGGTGDMGSPYLYEPVLTQNPGSGYCASANGDDVTWMSCVKPTDEDLHSKTEPSNSKD